MTIDQASPGLAREENPEAQELERSNGMFALSWHGATRGMVEETVRLTPSIGIY